MGLKKTVITEQGFMAENAYFRVEGVQLQSKTEMKFRVRGYKEVSGVPAFSDQGFVCAYDLNGSNPLAQAYAYAKTQDKFKDAVDC
jgi:hypothetical protein